MEQNEKPKVKDYQKYDRFPIQLSTHTLLMLHLFSQSEKSSFTQTMETVAWNDEHMEYWETNFKVWEDAAKQFFDQLEGKYSDSFLMAIIKEAALQLQNSDKRSEEFRTKYNANRRTQGLPEDGDMQQRAISTLEKTLKLIKNEA